jgi:uracil-DNA glycosylase
MIQWADIFREEKQKAYYGKIEEYVKQRRDAGVVVYPPEKDVFNAFKLTPFENVKVVILGQDPYHGANQAHGLAFSVEGDVAKPPSLVNIFKELASDIADFQIPSHGNLTQWATQGVLLLNTVLTVEAGQAHAHAKIGWEQFTDFIITQISVHSQNTIFLLWGSHAQKKGRVIDDSKHVVLSCPHPSPLSAHRGFFGSRHFSQTNGFLRKLGKDEINWQLV